MIDSVVTLQRMYELIPTQIRRAGVVSAEQAQVRGIAWLVTCSRMLSLEAQCVES